MKKILFLSACWIAYGSFPFLSGMFYYFDVSFHLYWNEAVLHVLSVFGYGMIGAWFYAFTGPKILNNWQTKHLDTFDRLRHAMLWVISLVIVDIIALTAR